MTNLQTVFLVVDLKKVTIGNLFITGLLIIRAVFTASNSCLAVYFDFALRPPLIGLVKKKTKLGISH